MTPIRLGEWTADIEPADVCDLVAEALTAAAADTLSPSVALIRTARILNGVGYAVLLSNGDHVAALSAGYPAYFREFDEGTYRVTLRATVDEGPWRSLPDQTVLDLDYCGPTWMPLRPPWVGLEFS